MTILIIMALLLLAVVFAVFFLIFKLIWLIFKKHTNVGPLIGAGICTLGCALLVTLGTYRGYKAIVAPFQEVIARVKQNPAPQYGERVYVDDTYPLELTVYDGMDFSKWISIANVQLKIGMDTNAFKKDAAGKPHENPLFAVLLRQANASSTTDPFATLQQELTQAQSQRRIEVTDMRPTEINGLPAYQVNGEAYTNRGKVNFWLTALQAQPALLYYVGVFAQQNTPSLTQQAQTMTHSLKLIHPSK